jgi:hypothetical protein
VSTKHAENVRRARGAERLAIVLISRSAVTTAASSTVVMRVREGQRRAEGDEFAESLLPLLDV